MIEFYFQNYWLLIAGFLTLASIVFYSTKRQIIAVTLLVLSALFLGIFMATLDKFVNVWDEQFHALVAKNMLSDPFNPILIKNPLYGYNINDWSNSHIWLHKQPLFLWQIAISMKFFGINEFAVRIPSVLIHGLMVLLIFRVSHILQNTRIAFISAVLYCWAYFPLEYITGFYATDHNDIAFTFYVFASFWAFFEYRSNYSFKFILLAGLFSGAAVLCKWLPGMIIHGIHLILLIKERKFTDKKTHNLQPKHFLISVLVCTSIWIPWQIYAAIKYPSEYSISMDFNKKHILEPLEGHGGDFLFYYNALFEQFGEGELIPLIIVGCLLLTLKTIRDRSLSLAIIIFICSYVTFFSLVKTKMLGYTLPCFPFFLIGLATGVDLILEWTSKKIHSPTIQMAIFSIVLAVLAQQMFNQNKIYKHHASELNRIKTAEAKFYRKLAAVYGGNQELLFNCNLSSAGDIPANFYTDIPSFRFIPPVEYINTAKNNGNRILIIDSGNLPQFILSDPHILKLSLNK